MRRSWGKSWEKYENGKQKMEMLFMASTSGMTVRESENSSYGNTIWSDKRD